MRHVLPCSRWYRGLDTAHAHRSDCTHVSLHFFPACINESYFNDRLPICAPAPPQQAPHVHWLKPLKHPQPAATVSGAMWCTERGLKATFPLVTFHTPIRSGPLLCGTVTIESNQVDPSTVQLHRLGCHRKKFCKFNGKFTVISGNFWPLGMGQMTKSMNWKAKSGKPNRLLSRWVF